jgi:hypothetical protein
MYKKVHVAQITITVAAAIYRQDNLRFDPTALTDRGIMP